MYIPYNPIYISALSFPNSMKVERCSKYGNTQNLGVTRSDSAWLQPGCTSTSNNEPPSQYSNPKDPQVVKTWHCVAALGVDIHGEFPHWLKRHKSILDQKSDAEDHPMLGNPISVEVVFSTRWWLRWFTNWTVGQKEKSPKNWSQNLHPTGPLDEVLHSFELFPFPGIA